jgi:hypothetical protein
MKRYKSYFDHDKESLPPLDCEVLLIEDSVFFVYYTPSDPATKQALLEAKQRGAVALGGPYSSDKHKPHTTAGEYHIHIYHGNNQIGSLNMSGSTHDSFHGTQLPRSIVPALQKAFPKFKIPENGLLEHAFKMNPMLEYYTEDISSLAHKKRQMFFG